MGYSATPRPSARFPDSGEQCARSVGVGGGDPGVDIPAAQTDLAPSRNDASAPKKAKVLPRSRTRYGVNAARRFAPMPYDRHRALPLRAQGVLQPDRSVVGASRCVRPSRPGWTPRWPSRLPARTRRPCCFPPPEVACSGIPASRPTWRSRPCGRPVGSWCPGPRPATSGRRPSAGITCRSASGSWLPSRGTHCDTGSPRIMIDIHHAGKGELMALGGWESIHRVEQRYYRTGAEHTSRGLALFAN